MSTPLIETPVTLVAPARPTRRASIPALTGIRFLAALWVVLFHIGNLPKRGLTHPQALLNFVSLGSLGVPLFFALSGFILSYSHAEITSLPSDRRRFWAARFARIYPVYLAAFLCSVALVILHSLKHGGERIPWGIALTGAAADLLLVQAWFWPLAGMWNTPSWSLSAEGFFYALFPLTAPKLRRVPLTKLVWLGVALWACSLVIPGIWMSGAFALPIAFVLYFPLLHLPTFFLGMITGSLYLRSNISRGKAGFISAASLVLIFLVCSLAPSIAVLLADGLVTPLFCALIYGLAHDGWPAKLLSGKGWTLLGEASYSIYLLQAPIWVVTLELMRWAGFHDRPSRLVIDTWSFLAIYLVLLISVSLATLRHLENPARSFLRSWMTREPVRAY